jgi:hypothetical protein
VDFTNGNMVINEGALSSQRVGSVVTMSEGEPVDWGDNNIVAKSLHPTLT